MAKRVDLEQGSTEWLEFRKNHIGASEAPLLMDESEYQKTLRELWEEKIGLDTKPFEANWAMRRGMELEPVALALFNEQMGLDLRPAVYVDERTGYLSASYDGISECGKIACEIKVPGAAVHEQARAGVVPRKYYGQVQQQIYICDVETMYYVSYNGDTLHIVPVARDDDYIVELLDVAKSFWYSVVTLTPPERKNTDIEIRSDEEWCAIGRKALQYKELYDNARKEAQLHEKMYKEQLAILAKLSPKHSAQGGGIVFKRTFRKGTIDYQSIPELKEINLEEYRKPPTEQLTLTKEKN